MDLPQYHAKFQDKDVLDCGCGGGQHINFVAPYTAHVTGVDFNVITVADANTKALKNVTLQEADIATMDLQKQFDIVYSIGVLHHTDDPTASFKNIAKHAKPGGKVITWVYSYEGNALNRYAVEPLKNLCTHHLPRSLVWFKAHILTALVYVPVYSLYLLPLPFLPYYQYFQNWRKLSYMRNLLNVFDKLNAPQTIFLRKETMHEWYNQTEFTDIHISAYKGVSWRASGTKK